MKTTVFDFIEELEKDIAEFYKRLRALSRLKKSGELLDFMGEHSEKHSKTVSAIKKKYKKPLMDNSLVRSVQNEIKAALTKEIEKNEDFNQAIKKIAMTEELVGKMYMMMAKYYSDLSTYYKSIEGEIKQIAEEEFTHRDMLFKEAEKYK